MGTKSRDRIYVASIRASAERAREARREADKLACEAWNQRMLGYKGPAQPSPAYALQGLLPAPRLSPQAQSCRRAAPDKNFGH